MSLLFNIPFCIIKKIKRSMLHTFLAVNGGPASIFVLNEREREREVYVVGDGEERGIYRTEKGRVEP